MMGLMKRHSLAALAAASLAVLGLVGCSSKSADTVKSDDGKSGATSGQLNLTVKEFAIGSDSATVPAGKVKVNVTNKGSIEHETVAFRTDLPVDGLPLVDDKSKVDEEGQGVSHLDPEAENIKPGTTKSITIDLAAGKYVFACNLPAHYGQGMRIAITAT
jgi:uncharacterized cupredoxin-like copper-binding protein